MTIYDIKQAIDSGETVRSIIEAAISRARQDDHNAIISVIDDRALARADEIDRKIADGEKLGRLAGIPFIAKDNILTFGAPTTAASHILEGYEAPYQATVIEKLELEGAICIAKANLDAFAHGGSTENSYFGPTTNAIDTSKVAGGSSGGSVVAVASGIVPFALGTDTGGSIRQPASFNGVVGYKPTYGSVSRYGVVAMASSTDVVGPIANNASDTALVYDCMRGVDSHDSTTIDIDEQSGEEVKTIGVIKQFLTDDVATDVRQATEAAIVKFEQAGAKINYIDMPIVSYALAVYYIVVPAEVSSNLARYDGIRYGFHAPADTLRERYEMTRSQGFMDENKRRILIGNYVLSSGYYDAYYKKAQTVRTKLIEAFKDAFAECDVLLCPVTTTTAFGLGEKSKDPLSMYLADTMTVQANLTGCSAISLPAGEDDSGMPIGLQAIMPMRADKRLLNFAKKWEQIRG